jgi:hypothetical protein
MPAEMKIVFEGLHMRADRIGVGQAIEGRVDVRRDPVFRACGRLGRRLDAPGVRGSALVASPPEIVVKAVHAGGRHIGAARQVEAGVEFRGRVEARVVTEGDVVPDRIHMLQSQLWMARKVELRIQRRSDRLLDLALLSGLGGGGGRVGSPTFSAAPTEVVVKGVHIRPANVRAALQIESRGEIRAWIEAGPPALGHEMSQRIVQRPFHLRLVEAGVELGREEVSDGVGVAF